MRHRNRLVVALLMCLSLLVPSQATSFVVSPGGISHPGPFPVSFSAGPSVPTIVLPTSFIGPIGVTSIQLSPDLTRIVSQIRLSTLEDQADQLLLEIDLALSTPSYPPRELASLIVALQHNFDEQFAAMERLGFAVGEDDPWLAAAVAIGVTLGDDVTVIGTVNDLAIPVILAGAAVYDLSFRTFVTYTLVNPATGQIYAGRTSGFGSPTQIMLRRYATHPRRVMGFVDPKLDQAVQGINGYGAIRGREQQLIDFHGGVGHPRVANLIRAVARSNPAGILFHNASNTYFGPLAPYTGN